MAEENVRKRKGKKEWQKKSIKEWRKLKNITVEDMAKRYGITKETWEKIEADTDLLAPWELESVAATLGVDVDEIDCLSD